MESPQGDKYEFALRFEFPASNNEAEYEAFIKGVKLALTTGARKVIVYSNSQLVVNQVNGNFQTKEE